MRKGFGFISNTFHFSISKNEINAGRKSVWQVEKKIQNNLGHNS